MFSVTKLLLVGAAALCAVSVDAHVVARNGEDVLTSLRQVAAPTPVVYHRRHHRRHHVRHPVHGPVHR